MDQFRNIGVIGRMGSVKVVESLRQLKQYLITNNYHVILEEDTASMLPGHGLQVASKKPLGEICDLVIVVGGDGSLLGAARELAKFKIPLLGVNRGRLGFHDISLPTRSASARFWKASTLKRPGFCWMATWSAMVSPGVGTALNDVVLHPGKSTRMIGFDLFIDGHFVYSQRSDGLIVATPTGSTAYSLSAGGPIMHPKLDAIVLVPMFPHTLSSRPIVVDGKSEIKLVIGETNETYPQISFDGQMNIACAPGDIIRITKKPFKIRLIHPTDHNFYATCRDKLGWASEISAS